MRSLSEIHPSLHVYAKAATKLSIDRESKDRDQATRLVGRKDQLAVMALCDGFHDGQAQAKPTAVILSSGRQTMERFQNSSELVSGNARTVVGNRDLDKFIAWAQSDLGTATILDRVVDQVSDSAGEGVGATGVLYSMHASEYRSVTYFFELGAFALEKGAEIHHAHRFTARLTFEELQCGGGEALHSLNAANQILADLRI